MIDISGPNAATQVALVLVIPPGFTFTAMPSLGLDSAASIMPTIEGGGVFSVATFNGIVELPQGFLPATHSDDTHLSVANGCKVDNITAIIPGIDAFGGRPMRVVLNAYFVLPDCNLGA